MKIKIGDSVQLKSGGPEMTVGSISRSTGRTVGDSDNAEFVIVDDNPDSVVKCLWFNHTNIGGSKSNYCMSEYFALGTLKRYSPAVSGFDGA